MMAYASKSDRHLQMKIANFVSTKGVAYAYRRMNEYRVLSREQARFLTLFHDQYTVRHLMPRHFLPKICRVDARRYRIFTHTVIKRAPTPLLRL